MARRGRIAGNSRKDSPVVREVLEHMRRDEQSLKQVAVYMKREGKPMSHERICRHVRADESGEPAGHCRHGMEYDGHGRLDCTAKAGNIPSRMGVHDRSEEAGGGRFGDWEMDTTMA